MPDNNKVDYLRKLVIASDPSLDRLRSGLRAVLTAGLAAALFLPVTHLLGLPYKLSLAGIVVPMMACVAVQDPDRRAQQITTALVPVVASVALVAGSLAADNVLLSRGLFLVAIFAAFQARRIGPRGTGLGMIGYLSYFYAMLLHVPPSQAAWDPLFVFLGCAVAYAVRFWLVPEHPGRMLRSEVRAYRARIGVLLQALMEWLTQGGRRRERRIDKHLAALNQQSLGLESRLADFACDNAEARAGADDMRDRVLRAEIAAEALVDVSRSLHAAGKEIGCQLSDRLRTLVDNVSGKASDEHDWGGALDNMPALSERQRWRLQQSVRALTADAPWRAPLPPMRDNRAQRETATNKHQPKPRHWWSDDTTRRALQACAAALGAMVVGDIVSKQHWYWAVIAAFVVFTRTGTVGQAASRAWLRVLATVAGVVLGLVVAELVHGSRTLELSLLFIFIAIGFYAFRAWQNVYVALLTAMLAMLYELLGNYSPGLLLERLEETAVGAGFAVLSAAVILPVRTRDESGRKSAALLRSARTLLCRALDPQAHTPARDAVRDLDRQLQALRQTLGTVTGPAYPGPKENRRRHLQRITELVFCVRHFYNLVEHHDVSLAEAPALRDAAQVLASNMEMAACVLDADTHETGTNGGIKPLPAPPAAAACKGGGDHEQLRIAAEWLSEANRVLGDIVGRARQRADAEK